MNTSKSRDIQAKMPSPKVIYASNESKSVLARNLEECRDNDKISQSVFLSFKCILARNCEGTEQLQSKTDSTQTGYFLRNIHFESNLFFCNYTFLTFPKPLSAAKIPALDLSRNRHIRPA